MHPLEPPWECYYHQRPAKVLGIAGIITEKRFPSSPQSITGKL
nr:MAG TPA: hypothetical protein [Caudoviricetes sp.]